MHDPKVTYRSVFGIEKNPAQWQTALDQANAGLSSELASLFDAAWQSTSGLPFPHIKLEKWRWLDLSQTGLTNAPVWTRPQFELEVELHPVEGESAGIKRDLPKGVVISTFGEALQSHPDLITRMLKHINKPSMEKFQALAEALARDGLFVYVPRGVKVDRVVVAKLHGKIDPGMSVLRSIIWLEPGAELKVVLDMQSESLPGNNLLHLAKTDLVLEEDARLHFTDVSIFKQDVTNLRYNQARLGRGAKLDWIYSAVATAQGKQSLEVNLEGEGAEAEVNGIYFPAGRRSAWILFRITSRRTRSNLLFGGLLLVMAETIWRGMIYVDQLHKNRRLSIQPNLMLGTLRDQIHSGA